MNKPAGWGATVSGYYAQVSDARLVRGARVIMRWLVCGFGCLLAFGRRVPPGRRPAVRARSRPVSAAPRSPAAQVCGRGAWLPAGQRTMKVTVWVVGSAPAVNFRV